MSFITKDEGNKIIEDNLKYMSNFEKRFDELEDDLYSEQSSLSREKAMQFFKEELKRITDLMIGNINIPRLGSENQDQYVDYSNGYNEHRQHCIDIINKELK